MAKFPKREPEIARLAQDLATGLAAHPEAFPSPPVPPEEIEKALATYNAARETAIVASAQASQGTTGKDEALSRIPPGARR